MRKIIFIQYLIGILLVRGCASNSNSTVSEEAFKLQDIYSYEYNSIEPEHDEKINEWLNEARIGETKIYYYSIKDDQDQGYGYIFAKGYKDFEVMFVYSSESMELKGYLHMVGIKGEVEDETFIKIKYDTRYILGTINSDHSILTTGNER